MNKIKSKIYYEINSGNILTITGEGDIVERTKESDLQFYPELEGRNMDEVDFIELEYGTLAVTFNNAKSYSINLKNKQLEVVHFTEEELNTMRKQNQETQDLNTRVGDISTYLASSDENTIANIENSILEIEKNKIINGGI